jgi:peptide/nickel transport system substrate-binding protein
MLKFRHNCPAAEPRRESAIVLRAWVIAALLASPFPVFGASTLHIGIDAAGLGTGDPHFAASRNDRIVADMVFNGLLRFRPGQAPLIEPDLAETIPEPKIVGGRQEWVFRIRRNVMCHPGPETAPYELSADDVVYSLRKSADPERSAYAGEYTGMTVEKIDDFTVRVFEEQPLSSILFFPKVADYAGGFIVCAKAAEAMGKEAFAKHPVGTGPFVFESYMPEDRVRLTRNAEYFRGAPILEGVVVKYVRDFASRNEGLLTGELDVIFGSEKPEWFTEMAGEKDFVVDVFGVGQVITVHLNSSKKPLDDVRVRKAVAYALDREVFRILFAEGVVANVYSPVPEQFLPGGLSQNEVEALGLDYANDTAKARALLAKAGLAEGFSLHLISSERGHYIRNYESLRDQLAEVGIRVEIEPVKHREMHKAIRKDSNAIVIYVAWRPNADVFLTRFFHSDSTVVSGARPDTNFSHYDQIDKLIEAARISRDPSRQVSIWKQAQIKILEDAVAYPLHYVNLVYARKASVDYGHPLEAAMALYPQINELTRIAQ